MNIILVFNYEYDVLFFLQEIFRLNLIYYVVFSGLYSQITYPKQEKKIQKDKSKSVYILQFKTHTTSADTDFQ